MDYSIQAEPLPLIQHQELGTLRLLSSFPHSQQPFMEHLIGIRDIRCLTLNGALYIPSTDIEPFTCDTDEWDLQDIHRTMQIYAATPTNDTAFAAALRLAEAHRVDIRKRRAALRAAVFQQTSFYAKNPFSREPFGTCFWADVAIVGAYNADNNAAKAIAQAYDDFLASVAQSRVDQFGLPNFFRVLLSIVDVTLAEHFADVWYGPGCGFRLLNGADASPQLVAGLRLLTLTFTGWRGDPEGRICPGALMSHCLLHGLVRRIPYPARKFPPILGSPKMDCP